VISNFHNFLCQNHQYLRTTMEIRVIFLVLSLVWCFWYGSFLIHWYLFLLFYHVLDMFTMLLLNTEIYVSIHPSIHPTSLPPSIHPFIYLFCYSFITLKRPLMTVLETMFYVFNSSLLNKMICKCRCITWKR
jgi:hypothetical protein